MTDPTPAGAPRLIKRYANRKLYDTGAGKLTSLRAVEQLVREGTDIQVVDHDSGEDITGDVLVGILNTSLEGRRPTGEISLLTSLIRAPGAVLAAVFSDQQRVEDLRAVTERVRLLAATMDALVAQAEGGAGAGAPRRSKK